MEPWEIEDLAKRIANLRNRRNNVHREIATCTDEALWEEYRDEIVYLCDLLAGCCEEVFGLSLDERHRSLWPRVAYYLRRLEGQPAVR